MSPHESPARPLRRPALAAAALTAAVLLLGFAESAAAETIKVNTTAAAAVDGKCSLAEAIQSANTDRSADVCTKGNGDDQISITVPGTITAPSDGFQIKSDMTIQGHSGGTTIDGGNVTVGSTAIVVNVGLVSAPDTSAVTTVTVADLTITNVPNGAGVGFLDFLGTATATPFAVVLSNLHLYDLGAGGVDSRANTTRAGRIQVVDSLIERTEGVGISFNCATGIVAARTVEVDNSVVRRNSGGGIDINCGRLEVVDSTVSVNSGREVGGIRADTRASNPVAVELVNATITGNTNVAGPAGVNMTVRNRMRGSLSITHSTITGNTATAPHTGGLEAHRHQTAVDDATVIDVTIRNSVIAGNEGRDSAGNPASSKQCDFGTEQVTKKGNAASDRTCGFGLVEADFGLENLAVNGNPKRIGPNQGMEPVKTRAFSRASPLLDAADPAACRDMLKDDDEPARDARGVPRPQGSGCDIGAYEMIVVGDRVWDDADGDGRQDSGEKGVAGVTVQLLKGTTVGATATTDANGVYRFPVGPGKWTVKVTDTAGKLAGRRATTPTSKDVSGDPADVAKALTADFGYQRLAALKGVVWVDSDRDGVRDTGEAGLEGAAVGLLKGGSQAGSAKTDANGAYDFTDLVPGSFELVVTAPVGYAFTERDVGSDDSVDSDVDPASGRSGAFALAAGATETLDAGVYRPKPPPGPDPDVPAPLLVLVKTASGEAPVKAGDPISYSFLVWNRGNVTLSQVMVADPKAGVVSCPGTVLAPEGSMTCTATYKASAADAKAGEVANTATVTGSAADGAKVSATDSATFDLASGGVSPDRLAGKDRYATAAVISEETFTSAVDVVYVATGVNFPDALAGSAASGGSGPILLVTKGTIPGATLAELKRLKPKRIVVLGGTGVVSAAVEAALKKHAATSRQAGRDRYSTAAAISAEHFGPGAATAFVATGADFPDALTGGPAAAKAGGPILLTQKDKLPSATVSELKRLKPKRIVVLGGTGVVSDAVEKALASHTSGKVSRLAGPDRYSTGGAISKDGFDQGAPVVYVATGLNFPDALAGGAAGAFKDGPVLLVSGATIPKATKAELTRLKPKRVVVLGGMAVVPESVEKALAAYIR